MIDEYGLVKIDANDTIHQKQKYFRELVADVLKKRGIKIEDMENGI